MNLPLCPSFDGDKTVLHLGAVIRVDGLPNKGSLQIFDAVYERVCKQ